MAASSVLTNSMPSMFSPESSANHETSHISISGTPALSATPPTSADNAPVAAAEQSSPLNDTHVHNPSADQVSDHLSSGESDEDAEGEPDEDFDATMQTQMEDEESDDEADSNSSRPGKRKKDVEEEDYMMKDPELYGLRRSGRARQSHRVADTSDDDIGSASDVDVRPVKRRKANISRKTSEEPNPAPLRQNFSDSESDSYGGRRAREQRKKERRRQMQSAAGMTGPSAGDVRFSNRRAGKITTYAEEENDDDLLEDEDSEMMTPSYYPAEELGPSVDKVLDHRRKPDSTAQQLGEVDYEYFVKWQGKAHYHATWEQYSSLSSLRGAKKVKNYFLNVVRREISMEHDPSVSLEDKEQYNLDRERQADALGEYTQVERVIDRQEGEEGTEYMVKWRGLFYDSCTWESADLVGTLAQQEIDRYLDRAVRLTTLDKTESNIKTRSSYKPFREQPDYIKGGQLREFQIKGINFLAMNWCKGNNVILADEMGLGKTVQTVSFISWLKHDRGQEGPHIVVVPLSTMPAWADTLDKWAPDINYVIYTGNEIARSTIRDKELFVDGNPRKVKFNVLLTTYDYMTMKGSWSPQLQQVKWQFLAVDEAHRLKNKESSLFAKLMELGAPTRLLITGTPMQNNLGELAALMNFLMPGKITVEDDIDLQSEAASQQLAELTAQISPYIIRRTKAKVENDLPPKTEKIIRVELSDFQLEYYKNILTRNYAALNEGGSG